MNGEKGTPYWKKLKDPRWQKRRLEVLARDGFKCVGCGTTSETLHVHHLVYRKGVEPWEAPMDDMVTVCERCHEVAEDKEAIRNFRRFMLCGLNVGSIREISKSMAAFAQAKGRPMDGNLCCDVPESVFGSIIERLEEEERAAIDEFELMNAMKGGSQ